MELKKGSVKRTLLLFTLPLIISLMAEQLYNIMDTIIVGRFLGIDELSAVGNAGSIIQVLIVISGGMEMGCEIVFAKFSGQWQDEKFKQSLLSVLLFCMLCAIALSVIAMLGREWMVAYMNIPITIISLLYEYYTVYVCFIVATFIYAVARAILLAMGNSRICMFLVLGSSLLNVILDLFFICILKSGVSGAAWATILSQSIGMVIALIILFKKVNMGHIPKIQKEIFILKLKEVLSIALPSIFQQFAITFSSLLLMSIVNPFGTQIISGYIAVEKIMMFALIPIVGLSMGISMFASANEENMPRIKEGFTFLNKISFAYTTLVVLLVVLIPKLFISPFIDIEENVTTYLFAKQYLLGSLFTFYLASFKFMNESLLRGFAKMKLFLCCNLSDLFVKVCFAFLFVNVFNEQVFWMAGLSGRMVATSISLYFLYKIGIFKKWKYKVKH